MRVNKNKFYGHADLIKKLSDRQDDQYAQYKKIYTQTLDRYENDMVDV